MLSREKLKCCFTPLGCVKKKVLPVRSLTPSPALCSESHPAAQPSPALCRERGQEGQRTCSATLPTTPSQENHPKSCGTSQGDKTSVGKEMLGATSPLCISSCLVSQLLCPSQRMLCSRNPLARLADPHGPTQEGLKNQSQAPVR